MRVYLTSLNKGLVTSQAEQVEYMTNSETLIKNLEHVPLPRWMADTSEGAILGVRFEDPESCQKATKVFVLRGQVCMQT